MSRAQLLESLAALGEREKEGDEARKELERYLGAYARISEQQAALYQTHVRETRALKARLAIADRLFPSRYSVRAVGWSQPSCKVL